MKHAKEQNWVESLPEPVDQAIAGNRRLSIAGRSRQCHKVLFIDFSSFLRAWKGEDYLYRNPLCHCLRLPATARQKQAQ
jgi:hypothetical protein